MIEYDLLGTPGRSFGRDVQSDHARYTVDFTVSVHDERAPYVVVAGWLGRGDDRHLIEFRLERQDSWQTCAAGDPGLASWVSDQLKGLASRADDVTRLAAPILQALHPETSEYSGLIVVVPAEGGRLVVRLDE